MRSIERAVILLALVSLGALTAQVPAVPKQRLGDDSTMGRQRLAATTMQESIEMQRASVQKQLGSPASAGFFVLPAPSEAATRAEFPRADCDRLPESEITALVDRAAEREDVDRDLLRSVMRQESGFRPCAVSEKGAAGLMQLMPVTAEQLGVKDLWKPAENVDAGAKLLKEMLTRYHGDVEKALAAYNAGPAAVDAVDGTPKSSETLDYIRQILSFLRLNP